MTICPEERCTGCGACQSACPADCIALALNRAGDRVAMIDESRIKGGAKAQGKYGAVERGA